MKDSQNTNTDPQDTFALSSWPKPRDGKLPIIDLSQVTSNLPAGTKCFYGLWCREIGPRK